MAARRFRDMFAGPASVALVLVMLAGCLFLWIGVPLAWLWIGSQMQSSLSLGGALMITMLGIVVSVVAVVALLGRLNRRHAELQRRRHGAVGGDSSALEVILVSSAGIAVVGFGIWFFGFAGASPVPLNIGF